MFIAISRGIKKMIYYMLIIPLKGRRVSINAKTSIKACIRLTYAHLFLPGSLSYVLLVYFELREREREF